MRMSQHVIALAALLALGGCAAPPITLERSFWEKKSARVAIAMATTPQADVAMACRGDCGVVSIAIAWASFPAPLTSRLTSLDVSRIDTLPERLAAVLQKQGIAVKIVEERLTIEGNPGAAVAENLYDRDFSALAAREQFDHLLLIRVFGVGVQRGYLAFVPATDPSGQFNAEAYLLDVQTRKLLWRRVVNVVRPVKQPWDQPPDYPNLTVAINDAVNAGIGLIVTDFSWFADNPRR
jgi:hypothetical protein